MRPILPVLVLACLLTGCGTVLDNGADPEPAAAPVTTISGEIRYLGDNAGTQGTPASGEVHITIMFSDGVARTKAVDGKFSFDVANMPTTSEISVETNMAGWVVVKTTVQQTREGLSLTVFVTPAAQAGPAKVG